MIDGLIDSLGQQTPAIDPFAGLGELLVGFAVWGIVIMVIIMTVQVVSAIFRFRSQQATIAMQKDIRAIREMLEKQQVSADATQAEHSAEGQGSTANLNI